MWHNKNAFFCKMQFLSHCYTVVSYQALFRLSVYKIPTVYLSGAKNVCFCTTRDFGSPTTSYVTDFNTRKKMLTQKLLKQGYPYHKLHKIAGNQGRKNANPCTRKVYSWILYGCKGNYIVYLKPLYSGLDRLA